MTLRVVLDTNVVVAALLFSEGRLAWVRRTWQPERICPVVCRETVTELLRVLAYPKFKLKRGEQEALLADFLPWAETMILAESPANLPACRDPDD